MKEIFIGIAVFIGVFSFFFLFVLIDHYLRSPFRFPSLKICFDVSGKRKPNIEDYIDQYLIENGMTPINEQYRILKEWKDDCAKTISQSKFRKRRQQQFNECYDEKLLFVFVFTREQTRYRQRNYVKEAFKVTEEVEQFAYSYEDLSKRFLALKKIHFAAPLSQYHSKNQRKLMTRELREQIAIRDNYTCQICGKYMPDEVGLQIDHIVPVAKGGKSIPENLQVLCSKCNGKKSSN